jgi:NitT/TauT family transport system substrate-binding protein
MNMPRQKNRLERKTMAIAILAFLVFAAGVIAPRTTVATETALKTASFMPMWTPQAQFAGYYVAFDKGFYAKHGIDLTILKAGPGQSPAQSLRDGKADFVVLWLTTALQHRSAGTKLVNLAQIVQRSSMMLIARKSSGIRTVDDMDGKKVGLWDGDLSIPPRALFDHYGIKVVEVPQSHTVNLFLRGGIDVTSAMWYNEYHTIINSGLDRNELKVVSLDEQGMNFPEDGIYVLEKRFREDPALAEAFVAASLEGWRYAFAHPEEALDIVIRYMREAKVPANRVHQKWMLDRMRDLVTPDPSVDTLGHLKEQDYESVGSALRKDGLVRSYPDYVTFTGKSDARKK